MEVIAICDHNSMEMTSCEEVHVLGLFADDLSLAIGDRNGAKTDQRSKDRNRTVKDLSLHILDIGENSIRPQARRVEISVVEDKAKDLLALAIKDDGAGMAPETLNQAPHPFFTTKERKRIGMGLALLAQATREADGEFEISSTPGVGTRIKATFRYSHPDRKPLGDIPVTLETLIAGNPGIDLLYEHSKGKEVTRLDTREAMRL